jgi:phosphoglycerol transferase MdoB-like AlkP superfamily enzyme
MLQAQIPKKKTGAPSNDNELINEMVGEESLKDQIPQVEDTLEKLNKALTLAESLTKQLVKKEERPQRGCWC